jgi:TatD DNase family protein
VLVDSHCHLGDPAYDPDRAEVAVRAWGAGVGAIVIVGESRAASDRALALAAADPRFSATAGVHPHDASAWSAESAVWLAERLHDPLVVAAGEMGLDYHYDHSPRSVQRAVFDAQLALAAEAGKPAVVHAREADDDVGAALAAHPGTTCVLHSFSSRLPLLRRAVALGHYVSFSGMITFRSWQADDVIRETPIDRLLVETDGPYLAPAPHRGRRNEPAFVAAVAARLAEVLGLALDEVTARTSANARRLFGARIPATLS